MARMRRTLRRISLGMAAVTAWSSVGCLGPRLAAHRPDPPITVPEHGTVPTELNMVNLPEYVIEPPDVLIIQVRLRETLKETEKDKEGKENKDGKKVTKKDPKTGKKLYDGKSESLPIQGVDGQHRVRLDGTVYLGVYGSVPVTGLTLKQAAEAVRSALAPQIEKDSGGIEADDLLVVMDVTEYNSKSYYVITDGGGNGEKVDEIFITGKETVLSAVAKIGGLSDVSSKRNIWVARRTPFPNQPQQILPVDWVGLSQWGQSATNWQIFPGDRIYIKAERAVTVATKLGRVLAPVEKVLGVTLLGANSVNQISGRGNGFNNAANR